MKTRFAIANPDQMEATLSLTLTIAEWKKLREQLRDLPVGLGYPANLLQEDISVMIRQVIEHLAVAEVDGQHLRP